MRGSLTGRRLEIIEHNFPTLTWMPVPVDWRDQVSEKF
jgi:hypothetical protein